MSLKKKIQNKVKEILKNKKITDYELEIDCDERLIFITINDITSKIEFKFEDFMILTNFFNIWGIYLEDEISRIITLKKWVVCLKNDCCIKQINFCKPLD